MNFPPKVHHNKAVNVAAGAHYRLRLFVIGGTPTSVRAIKNIRELCDEKLQGHYDLEVIDVFQHPEDLKPDAILVTPTLIRKLPLPFRKIIGDLSDQERVIDMLIFKQAVFPLEPMEEADIA
jgi:circadian clock protein KaiB